MSYTYASWPEDQATGRSLGLLVLASLALHLTVIIAVPLLSTLMWHPRPVLTAQTFQVVRVSPPASSRPAKPPAQPPKTVAKPAPQPKPVPSPAVKPVPKQPSKAAEPQKAAPQEEEDVSDLTSLLEGVAQPAVAVSVGADFKYAWYINAIRAKVEQNWHPPFENPDVYTDVQFSIFVDGSISEVKVAHSSGDATLDNLAVRAIRLAAPFGKLPVGETNLDVSYKLRPTRKS